MTNFMVGDLVLLDNEPEYSVMEVDDNYVYVQGYGPIFKKFIECRLSRPPIKVGMWVRFLHDSCHGPKRVGKIGPDLIVFDALVSQYPGREGEISNQPAGRSACVWDWVPVVAPKQKKAKPAGAGYLATTTDYQVGDLVQAFDDPALDEVVVVEGDHLKLRDLGFIHRAHIRRPMPRAGMWVRSGLEPGWERTTILRIERVTPERIFFDAMAPVDSSAWTDHRGGHVANLPSAVIPVVGPTAPEPAGTKPKISEVDFFFGKKGYEPYSGADLSGAKNIYREPIEAQSGTDSAKAEILYRELSKQVRSRFINAFSQDPTQIGPKPAPISIYSRENEPIPGWDLCQNNIYVRDEHTIVDCTEGKWWALQQVFHNGESDGWIASRKYFTTPEAACAWADRHLTRPSG